MKLTLGFSPCPNDTFIFDALVHQKIDTEELEFEVILEDVETLNEWALEGKLDVTKLSFPALFQSLDKYVLLNSGSALGRGVGPLLVSKSEVGNRKSDVENSIIVLPGKNTTANFLFSFAYPAARNKVFMRFDRIEDCVLGKYLPSPLEEGTGVRLGVVIHESRFTYHQKGLHKILDLGEYWEGKMNLPIPLGGIAVKTEIEISVARKIDGLIKKSLEYAYTNYPELPDYVRVYSQTMSEEVMRKHIELYVNMYSLDLGVEGKKAIEKLYEVYKMENGHSEKEFSPGKLFIS